MKTALLAGMMFCIVETEDMSEMPPCLEVLRSGDFQFFWEESTYLVPAAEVEVLPDGLRYDGLIYHR